MIRNNPASEVVQAHVDDMAQRQFSTYCFLLLFLCRVVQGDRQLVRLGGNHDFTEKENYFEVQKRVFRILCGVYAEGHRQGVQVKGLLGRNCERARNGGAENECFEANSTG